MITTRAAPPPAADPPSTSTPTTYVLAGSTPVGSEASGGTKAARSGSASFGKLRQYPWAAARRGGGALSPGRHSAHLGAMSSESLGRGDVPPCGCATPGTTDAATCYCGVEDLLRIIRRRYSLAVLRAIHARGVARYHDVADALPQASSSTLAETLRALAAAQLVRREDLGVTSPHTEYRLTHSGAKLLNRLRRLLGEIRPP